MRRIRNCDFVKCFFLSKKLRDREVGPFFVLEEEASDIKPCQINSIVDAVVIWIAQKAIVPRFEIAIEHQV
jgi:hypothetical protein